MMAILLVHKVGMWLSQISVLVKEIVDKNQLYRKVGRLIHVI
jgi:hypothetical protein